MTAYRPTKHKDYYLLMLVSNSSAIVLQLVLATIVTDQILEQPLNNIMIT